MKQRIWKTRTTPLKTLPAWRVFLPELWIACCTIGEMFLLPAGEGSKVLDEIDYHPNMFAIGLAAKKRYRVLCIIPYYVEHDYWHSVAEGINRAAQELRPLM